MSSLEEWLREAESGDLRPQVNPQAIVGRIGAIAADPSRSPVVRALLQRFFTLARPIGDSSRGIRPELRLQDAGPFFYLVESLTRLGRSELEESLLILLDEFAQLEERSYDELYLWSIVHLSRTDPRHVDTFWPMAAALDLRFRSAAWQRPAAVSLVEAPYRLTELLFYYYYIYTLQHGPNRKRRTASLAMCVQRLVEHLSAEQRAFVRPTLRELAQTEEQPAFSDASGLLLKPRK
jgi:hypothetical protein